MPKQPRISLRPVGSEDRDDLYLWANDRLTRLSRFNGKKISYEAHKQWFADSLNDPGRTMWIGLDGAGEKIGLVRVDARSKYAVEFDINVAPAMRGRGYGEAMIRAACREYNRKRSKVVFIARIKEGNERSVRAFEKAGFFRLFDYAGPKGEPVIVLGRLQ
jgi:UDP-2,4-diacetamido-2,4,6-trideoxy-beta-L-altropyranose hydrolase